MKRLIFSTLFLLFSGAALAEDCVEGSVALRAPDQFVLDLYGLSASDLPSGVALMQCGAGGVYDDFPRTEYMFGTLQANQGNAAFVRNIEALYGETYADITARLAEDYLDDLPVQLLAPETEAEVAAANAYAGAHNARFTRDNESFRDNVRMIDDQLNNLQYGRDIRVTDLTTLGHAINHNETYARGLAERCARGEGPEQPLFALNAEFSGAYTNPDRVDGEPSAGNQEPATLTYFPASIREIGNGRVRMVFRDGDQMLTRDLYQSDDGRFYWIGGDGFHYEVRLQLANAAKYQLQLQTMWAHRSTACAVVQGVDPSAYSVPEQPFRTIQPPSGGTN